MRGIDAVLQELTGGTYDIKIGFDGDLETEDSFDTYITVALLTDARATESEIQDPRKRRGWIGNEHTPDFDMGSKLFLFEQSRLTRTIINQVQDAARNALQSLVDDEFALAILSVDLRVTANGVTLELEIQRTTSQVEKRFFKFWELTGV